MKKMLFNADIVERFNDDEMIVLAGGGWKEVLQTILDIMGIGGNVSCPVSNKENCKCNGKCSQKLVMG